MPSKRRRRSGAAETIKLNTREVRESIARRQQKLAALIVMQGAESDIGQHVVVDKQVTLGRDPVVELPLADEGISRRHCAVMPVDDHYVLEDLHSTNGTLLNGNKIEGRQRLSPGDRIYLGACVVKFTHTDGLEVTYHQQMDTLVGTDDLTGLIAKRRFDALYVRALDSARHAKKPLTVMMLDMDGLKSINDTHGHPIGGHAIAEVGKIIGSVISEHGAACRFGGDEFAAYLPGVCKTSGVEIGESIRSQVAGHTFEKDGVVVRPTISIGIAAYPEDGRSADTLLRRADEALYRAKKTGRDRVHT
jgi:two-component system, cell cycle response regulator